MEIRSGSEENQNKERESPHAMGLGSGNRNPSERCILPTARRIMGNIRSSPGLWLPLLSNTV
jgi:hypothetical protein